MATLIHSPVQQILPSMASAAGMTIHAVAPTLTSRRLKHSAFR